LARDLREECLSEAARILRDEGAEHLSLREVARRLGVSHQAPYRHFPSKDALVAELVRRAYADFARHLSAGPELSDPHAALADMGRRYLAYAAANPFEYRLMFAMPLPDPAQHPEMLAEAHAAFDLLRHAIGRIHTGERVSADALFVWSTMHGLASLVGADVIGRLGLGDVRAEDLVLEQIGRGLG
jgi:AcrR family transcriptional regulator